MAGLEHAPRCTASVSRTLIHHAAVIPAASEPVSPVLRELASNPALPTVPRALPLIISSPCLARSASGTCHPPAAWRTDKRQCRPNRSASHGRPGAVMTRRVVPSMNCFIPPERLWLFFNPRSGQVAVPQTRIVRRTLAPTVDIAPTQCFPQRTLHLDQRLIWNKDCLTAYRRVSQGCRLCTTLLRKPIGTRPPAEGVSPSFANSDWMRPTTRRTKKY